MIKNTKQTIYSFLIGGSLITMFFTESLLISASLALFALVCYFLLRTAKDN